MTSLTPLDPLGGLDALVLGQHGVLSRDQALAIGLTTRQIEWRMSTGRWARLHRVVHLTQPGREDRPMRTSAAVLACGHQAVLSHASAAVEHGLRTQ